jgi:hypothetical protein
MALELKEEKIIAFEQADIEHALELILSECFPAMRFANALAGSGKTKSWKLIHNFPLNDIFAEAKRMAIDLRLIKPAILSKDKKIDDLAWVKKYLTE